MSDVLDAQMQIEQNKAHARQGLAKLYELIRTDGFKDLMEFVDGMKEQAEKDLRNLKDKTRDERDQAVAVSEALNQIREWANERISTYQGVLR